jgi:hypothetical protein
MQLDSFSIIPDPRFAEIAVWVGPQTTTERAVNAVIKAGYALHDAHQMDEYTIDLVVELPDGLVLVYDTT